MYPLMVAGQKTNPISISTLEIMAICFTLIKALKYSHHFCVMISTDNTGGTHSPNLCLEVWKILQWCLEHHIVIRICHIPGKFNVLADRLSRINKIVKTEWALDQSIPIQFFKCSTFPVWIWAQLFKANDIVS